MNIDEKLDELVKLNKMVHPELDGACAICGINPNQIKQLFQELIDEVIPPEDAHKKISNGNELYSGSTDTPSFRQGFEMAIHLAKNNAKELLEKYERYI